MKKTININLGGQPFIIDEQAYDVLHVYFEALKQKFTNENERKEILADIEARVAEVFTQRLDKTRAVVSEDDVHYIISLMGRPEDIAGEPENTSTNGGPKGADFSSSTSYTGPVEKKFFRDPDDKKVGGVISGLCHYFGWSDPTWIRIGFVAIIVLSMFASLGLGFPLVVVYLILLIVVPEANTSAEKLQMQGKPVTLQNIEKEVRDAMTTAGASVNSIIKDNNTGKKFFSILLMIGKAFAKIVLAFVLFICILLMLTLGTSFFGLSILSSASLSDITHLIVSNRYVIMLFNIGLLLAIGIPLVSIMYDIIRFLAGSNVKNPALKRALWGAWLVGLVMLLVSSWSVCKYFVASDTITEKVQLMTPPGGTLRVQLADTMGHVLEMKNKDDEKVNSFIRIDGLSKTQYGYAFSDLKMEVAVSPDTNFYVERVSFSKGANFADAARNIQLIHYKFSQTDTTLNLDDQFELPNNGKWRKQRVKIRIYVPEGKRITFAENVDQIESSVNGNDYFDDGMLANKTLHAEDGKLKCLNCNGKTIVEEEDKDKDDDADDDGKPKVTVKHGKDKDDLKDVSVTINQNGVSVSGKNEKEEKVKIKVDNQGVKVITTDTNGNTKITKKIN